MKRKYKLLFFLLILGCLYIFSISLSCYHQKEYTQYVSSIKEDSIYSLVVQNYDSDARIEANNQEISEILELLKKCQYDGMGRNKKLVFEEPYNLVYYNLNSKDSRNFPSIHITIYYEDGEIKGYMEANGRSYKLKNCQQLYYYAFKICK